MMLHRPSFGLALLFTASGAVACSAPRSSPEATETSSARLETPTVVVRPYEQAMGQGFGAGYNPLTGLSPTPDCALSDEAARCAGGDCREKWTFRVQPVFGHEDLLDKLGVSSGARADLGADARLAKVRLAAQAKLDIYETAVLVSARHAIRELSVPAGTRSLNPDYEQVLQDDPEGFLAACGTELPVTLTDGDEMFVLFPVRSSSDVSLLRRKAQVEGLARTWDIPISANPNPGTAARERAAWQSYYAGLSAVVTSLGPLVTGDGLSLSRTAGPTGPSELFAKATVNGLRAMLDAFGQRPAGAQPLFLDGTFARYDQIIAGLGDYASTFDVTADTRALAAGVGALAATQDAIASASYAKANGAIFPKADAGKLTQRLNDLATLDATVRAEVKACLATRASCSAIASTRDTAWIGERSYSGACLVDRDADCDHFDDAVDNCPYVPNIDQLDRNGDGRGDDCTPLASSKIRRQVTSGAMLDFDGDGKADIFTSLLLPSGEVDGWAVSFRGASEWVRLGSDSPKVAEQSVHFGDFDGDGRTDVVVALSNGTLAVSYGGRLAPRPLGVAAAPSDRLHVGDFDGNGRADLLVQRVTSRGVECLLSDGVRPWQPSGGGCDAGDLGLGDFNGDGKTDLFATVFETYAGRWRLSWGGTTPWQQVGNDGGDTYVSQMANFRFGDLNGDGRDDFFVQKDDVTKGVYQWLSFVWVGGWNPIGAGDTSRHNDTTHNMLGVTDLNGDGIADVLARQADGRWLVANAAEAYEPLAVSQGRFSEAVATPLASP